MICSEYTKDWWTSYCNDTSRLWDCRGVAAKQVDWTNL